ncbi:MAG TPA: hypothetical protein VMF03_16640 [Steroidobacteraceae bacterium]|nr:hypothetical protein [Steroidobacteraceae bacterium]
MTPEVKWLTFTALLARRFRGEDAAVRAAPGSAPDAALGAPQSLTVACTIGFFWLRVAHAIVMLSGRLGFPMRPALCFAGWVLMVMPAWQVLVHAAPAPDAAAAHQRFF